MATELLRFEGVQIRAADLEPGVRQYQALLGIEPVRLHSGAWRFQLDRGAVELVSDLPEERALRFSRPGELPPGIDFHGIDVRATPVVGPADVAASASAEARGLAPDGTHAGAGPRGVRDVIVADDAVYAIDHVVVRSTDLERAIALWRDRLGIRLALDREFPGRGLRMLFFRSAGMTLEFVSALGAADPSGRDAVDGVAYQVRDLARCRARLVAAGLDVSELRDGFKRGTRVATVRSGTLGVPTLLIEHLDRGDRPPSG